MDYWDCMAKLASEVDWERVTVHEWPPTVETRSENGQIVFSYRQRIAIERQDDSDA